MRTIARIIILLLAALIVVGVTMVVTNSSSTAPNGQPPQTGDGTFVPGERPEGGTDGEGDSAFGWLRHLLPISGIILVVVVIERLWGEIFKPRTTPVV